MPDESAAGYMNPELSAKERAADIVSQMTLEEKVSQMVHNAPPISRLGVPEYNWWNECLHGVARAGLATVFPQAIGMAASFNTPLMRRVADVISDEARAKYNQAIRQGNRGAYMGLTMWTPNINIFRDPRWGRGHETYGEDPYLTARMGVEFVKGLQGDDPNYLKLVATPKHYAVHSGPESLRHSFDAVVSQRDLRETYLPAFKACVQEAKAFSVMGAYNRTNGEACCASPTLLQKILREEWGFDGYVVSDCWAIRDFHTTHEITNTAPESAAMAVKNGCELNCGEVYPALLAAVDSGLIDEATITQSVTKLFEARFRLGMFDDDARVPWSDIGPEVVACDKHRDVALQMARESVVLLKNEGNILPLAKTANTIMVTGPNSFNLIALQGNYNGYSDSVITPLEGIVGKVSVGTRVMHDQGCELWGGRDKDVSLHHASSADLIIAVMGLTAQLEGEEGDAVDSDAGGDKRDLSLPEIQQKFLEELVKLGKPVILVMFGGSPVDISWAQENIPAIIWAWYPGEKGGAAIADVLFGDYNPAGRLPVTFPKSMSQVPDFEQYNMAGRTYRFMDEEPLYRFGYGLSYTSFAYSNLQLDKAEISADQMLTVKVDVRNTGPVAGDEVVQAYYSDLEASVPVPIRQLAGFQRIHLTPGETQTVEFTMPASQFCAYDDNGQPMLEPGEFEIFLGGGQGCDANANGQSVRFKAV